jgi:hypothetical protein
MLTDYQQQLAELYRYRPNETNGSIDVIAKAVALHFSSALAGGWPNQRLLLEPYLADDE